MMMWYIALLLVAESAFAARQCGVTSVSQRVIGGHDVKQHAWPWQISMLKNGNFNCGGSLISPTWIVTAAHCVASSSNPSSYQVVVGDHNRYFNEGTEQTLQVKRVIAHPQYNSPRLSNDIALMELASPAVLSEKVNPVCLPPQDYQVPPGSKCYITGWGKIKHPGSSHHILQQAMMPPLSQDACKKKAAQSGFGIGITDTMVCAGIEGNVVSGCHGDSGGPYVCVMPDGRYTLQGDVSWGSGSCDSSQMFTVFGRVAKFRNWIDQHVGNGGTNPPPPPTNNKFSCDFEKDTCGFIQLNSDQFDWTRQTGSTPSSGTGPNTGNSGKGYYMYIEASYPRLPNDQAIMEKAGISFDGNTCIRFFYHMNGNDVNKLEVQIGSRTIFTTSGSQGDKWNMAKIKANDVGVYPLRFKGVRGQSWQGDIAIDDITVASCAPPTKPPTMNPISCDFDAHATCGFQQSSSDKFDWTRYRGSTGSYQTGPTSDHTNGQGYYMYIETSHPRVNGDSAVIERAVDLAGGNACMRFFYHMYGSTIGELRVNVGNQVIFSKNGDQGNAWMMADVRIAQGGLQTIKFEGVRGGSYTGDIAIDDITIKTCGVIPPPPPSTAPPPPPPTTAPPPPTAAPPPPTAAPPPPTAAPPPGSCGVRPSTRIVGGTAAKQGSWPWQVQLRTTSGFPYCGGSLIHPQWILTATHCVRGKSASSIVIRAGAHFRTSNVGTEQDIQVSKVITHASYHNPTSYAHDIALLKLATPAKLNKNVNLVCLPEAHPAPTDGTKCWITGWGRLSSGGATPNILQQVSVPVASRARCDIAYPGKIHDSMLCAGLDQGGIDTCQGDSGGPLVCETGGRYYIHGATSWGYGCASPGKFGVYAKVKYLLGWIKNEMAKN